MSPFFWAALIALCVALLYKALPGSYVFHPGFQVYETDAGDYRFVAEHFWGIPHNLATFAPDFRGQWGRFLTAVPFRDIAVGSTYLAVHALVGSAADSLVPWLLMLSWCLAFAWFFVVCRRQFGTVMAGIAFALLLFPLNSWAMTQELLTEPFLRPLFVVVLTLLLKMREKPDQLAPHGIAILLVCLLMAHVKIQWMLYGALLGAALIAWAWFTRHRDAILPLAVTALSIPLSLMLVHGIGWQNMRLVQGTGLHVLWVSDGDILTQTCEEGGFHGYTPNFCESKRTSFGNWGIFMASLPPTMDLGKMMNDLDAQVRTYALRHPYTLVDRLREGFAMASVYPEWDWTAARGAIDAFTITVLLAALFIRRTQLVAVGALGLWIIPAVCNMLAIYDVRYHRPMEGLLFVISFLLLKEVLDDVALVRLWRSLVRLCSDEPHRTHAHA